MEKELYPATFQQQGVWLKEKLDSNGLEWKKKQKWALIGDLDIERLKLAIVDAIKRHKSLRTSFKMENGSLYQYVRSSFSLQNYFFYIREQDIPPKNEFDFKLDADPLIFFILKKIKQGNYEFTIIRHHIISDITSSNIISKEIFTTYNDPGALNKKEGESVPLMQYTDYAIWQKEYLETEEYQLQKEFWLDTLKGNLPELSILPRHGYKKEHRSKVGVHDFYIDTDRFRILKNFSLRSRIPFSAVTLLAQYLLLSKYSGQNKIVVGFITHGRKRADHRTVTGLFANKLALVFKFDASLSFKEALLQTSSLLRDALKNQDVVFQDIQSKISDGRHDIIKSMYNYIKVTDFEFNFDGLTIHEISDANPQYDLAANEILSIYIFESRNSIKVQFRYPESYFEDVTLKSLSELYLQILDTIVENPETKIADVPSLTPYERMQVYESFNNTHFYFSSNKKCIHQLFEEQVEAAPSRLAISFDDVELSYGELNNLSNMLAEAIIQRTNGVKSRIGIYMVSSVELVASILAVLKTGSSYVPISVEAPEIRNQEIINNCQIDLLLTHEESEHFICKLKSYVDQSNILYIKRGRRLSRIYGNPAIPGEPDDVANVIYTSGTSGVPKGVEVKHGGIVNFISWRIKNYNIKPADICLQLLSHQFDGYGAGLFTALLSGGQLVLVRDENRLNPKYIFKTIQQKAVTNYVVTPGLHDVVLEGGGEGADLPQLRLAVLAGEKASVELIKRSREKLPHTQIANEYGPTEASIGCIAHANLTIDNVSVIGMPISNMRTYIVDKEIKMTPIGVPGEICIAGPGLAKGYLNDYLQTRQRFIKNPFEQSGKLYRTGDIGRWLCDGTIEFLGRLDSQIKIRGYRVELKEIEYCIESHSNIKKAIVIAGGEKDAYLLTYYTSENEIKHEELVKYMSKRLPYYMLPNQFYWFKAFPLTENGKIDVDAFPKSIKTDTENVDRPASKLEKQVAKLWSELLRINDGELDVNKKFHQYGGDSLSGIGLISKLNHQFDIDLQFSDLYDLPSIRLIALDIEAKIKLKNMKIERGNSSVIRV